jgi:apolipoprotein N-acyltransferase
LTTERVPPSRWQHLAGLFASILLLAAYARVPQAWPLGFVALVPWLLALDALRTARGALLAGVLASVAFMAAVFSWFGAAIGAYTGVGAVVATVVLVLLAPLLQPQWIAFALVRYVVGRRHGPLLRAVAAAAAWVASEWLVPKLLGDTLGHGLFPSTTLRQAADLGGAAGLTVLLLLVNEAVALALARRGDGVRRMSRPLAAGLAVVVAMAGYGTMRLATLQAPPDTEVPALRIAMVQAGITDYERLRREMGAYAVVREILDTHYALSLSALRDHGADVLLWSETVYPTTFGSPRSEDGAAFDREIQDFVDTVRAPLVFGTYDADAGSEYNAAVFLEPGRGRLGTYRKTHPFPLTEYVPRWMDGAWLRRVLPWAGAWQPGDGARVLPLRGADGREVNVVPLICLDDVHPGLAIDGARLGAQAIVGMSNDSWFTAQPVGARLHLAVAAFRSIETRLPQVRVTTNGLSAIIDDTGTVVASTAMGQQAVLTAFVSARTPAPTLMVRWGDWVGRASGLFLLVLAMQALWRTLRSRAGREDEGPEAFDVAVLPPVRRAVAAALRLCAGLGLAWIALDMALHSGWQVQSMSQLWRYVAAVLAPAVAAWAIVRASRARARVEGDALVLDQRRRRIEIPLPAISALRPWRLPLPARGLDLALGSGRRWPSGLLASRPVALRRVLATAGAPLAPEVPPDIALASHAEARGAATRPWLDHALVKFALFPLLPALVAFRLHQVIAYGGTFGEYYTYGPAAWLGGLLIWWVSWSMGLMLLAAALRVAIETACAFSRLMQPRDASSVRDALEWLGRGVYYVGVPAWLGLRLLAA